MPRGRPKGSGVTPVEYRFWTKVNRDGPVSIHRPDLGPCWLWTASQKGNGYGQFGVEAGRTRGAHVVAWELTNGPVPEGLELDHLCRVPLCVRPTHQEPVPHGENTRRGLRGRELTGRCRSGLHEIHGEEDLVVVNRTTGAMTCRACRRINDRARQARYNARKKENACPSTPND